MPEQEISLKNTKAEILDALNRTLERMDRAEKNKLDPEKQEKMKTEAKAVESAKNSTGQEIFSRELIEKFKDLQTAITVEENRLQELYGVGRELQKLALTIEAGRDKISEIQTERSAKEEAAQASIKTLNDEFKEKNVELQTEHDALLKKLKQERTREAEEFQYNLTRARERENNTWADEKSARESELAKRESRAAELLAEAEEKTEYIKSLEAKVEKIPELVSSERESAAAITTDTLEKEYGHKNALAEMERKNIIDRLEDKVKYLEKELDISNKSVALLQNKLDKAYSEMRDLAAKTVESASGVKIIGGPEKIGA